MILPREYFSWSQFDLWNRSKKQYYERYILNKPFFETKYIKKGKQFANMIASGELSSDANLNDVLMQVQRGDIFEYEIECKLGITHHTLKGFIDSANADGTHFFEYKTGKELWDDDRVQDNKQILFYALMYYLKYGTIPTCTLIWIETIEDIEGNLIFSGRVDEFHREFYLQDLVRLHVDIFNTITEIEGYDFQEMPLDDELLDEYIKLEEARGQIDSRITEIRDLIKQDLEIAGLEYAMGTRGKFTLSKRGTWKYTDKVKELQKQEQKTGLATQEFSSSLRFSLNKEE